MTDRDTDPPAPLTPLAQAMGLRPHGLHCECLRSDCEICTRPGVDWLPRGLFTCYLCGDEDETGGYHGAKWVCFECQSEGRPLRQPMEQPE